MSIIDVVVPRDKVLPHQTLQLRVFDRGTRKFVGSAVYDRQAVNFEEENNIIRGKPVLNVLIGDPFTPLDTYLSVSLLDGLYYPVLEVPT